MSPSKPAPAEPVAWAQSINGRLLGSTMRPVPFQEHEVSRGYTVVPLYAHPPAPPAPAERLRKALSEAIELLEDPETPQTKVSRKLAWMREVRDAALGGREEAP